MSQDKSGETPEKIDLTPEKNGGVLKEILKAGDENEGSPSTGDKVFVHYVGTLLNGEKFDSSRDRGEKFEFTLGTGQVIKAWDLGVASMKKGEVSRLTCQSDYAYGDSGSPPKIPPKATLIFEVELFSWKGEDLTEKKNGGIIRSIKKQGDGFKTPKDGSTVNIHLVGKYKGRIFEERDVEFIVGEPEEQNVIEGIDIAVTKMKKGEKSVFKIAPTFAYGQVGNKDFDIPAEAHLEYEVYLSCFENAKEAYEMDPPEKLEQSEIMKAKGGNLVKAGKYLRAIKCYKKIIDYLEHETTSTLEEAEKTKRDFLMLAAHLNLALCYLKTEEFNSVCDECEKALEFDPKSTKAYFRRGQAYFSKHEYELAKANFEKVLECEPENKAAKNQIILSKQKIKQFKDKEKKTYSGMFTKFAQQDIKVG
ncbi:hypothetical protein LOTGIDRAFT_102242 [Lottia gigantea]|uniref:peptidylprolyl isomerase n=1 Tax=Lottia gigantea TaxID=225164 RepID=V4ALQ1_LOTGI|nr:hypothetical protein LOTGIDRAFT_102242 [Lottia gigantea]ESP05114.1 hypothetical protein LOTGIDRAFT_102242 [Lottia gigantea]